MQAIQSILNSQPRISSNIITTNGFCIWICWSNGPDPQANKKLEDAGGIEIAKTSTQSLWFFFNVEITFLALAKLELWAKQFSMGLTAFTFPAELNIGPKQALSVEVTPEISKITTEDPKSLIYVFTHPSLCPYATSLPNISFYDMTLLEKQGLFGWKMVIVDSRLPLNTGQGWFAFLHPIGNPLDKQYQKGWEKIFSSVEPLLADNKLKYTLQSGFLSVVLSDIQQLRIWTEQLLIVFNEIHNQHQDLYWPCLSIIVDKKNINFTTNVHENLNIDWNSLCPDTPYLNYKNAFLLGKSFAISDIHYSSVSTDINSLCTVSLKSSSYSGSFPPLIAKVLASASTACFYCGSGSHNAAACPTKYLEPTDTAFWKNLDRLDFNDVNNAYYTIDNDINQHGVKAYSTLLESGGIAAEVLRATFAINSSCQLPNIARIWQISTRDMEETPGKTKLQKEPAWNILNRFTQIGQDANSIERDCLSSLTKDPKNWHLHCLRGFLAMERGDFDEAIVLWREAENLCSTTTQQAWIKFLVARIREIQGFHNEAFDLYLQAQGLLPNWQELEYRINVCMVKKGFAQNATSRFANQIIETPELFHKIFFDPELARGHFHLLAKLLPIWEKTAHAYSLNQIALEELFQLLEEWFAETDSPMVYYGAKIKEILSVGNIQNYLFFLELIEFKEAFETDLTRVITQEVNILRRDYEVCLSKVEFIRDEMNWFYFQKALTNFNTTFNDCALMLNWAFISNFNEVRTYKEARTQLPKLQKLIESLNNKLTRLRMVRDITLFLLLLIKAFLKTLTVLIILSFLMILTMLFFGESLGLPLAQSLVRHNFWEILKVVASVTLMLSFGLASLKTTILFEKKRNELLTEAKAERIKAQQIRITKAKMKRAEEEKRAKLLAKRNAAIK